MNDQVRGAFGLFGQAAAQLVGAAIDAIPQWAVLTATLEALRDDIATVKELVMALSANEQQAVNDLSSAVNTLSTDLAEIQASAEAAKAAMQTQIDQLTAQGQTDQATIQGLQAAADQIETDVVGALSPLTQRLTDMDANLKNPATPLTPTA